jgi:hypothetical protein
MYAFYSFSALQGLHIWAISCLSYHTALDQHIGHILQMLPALPTIVMPCSHYALQDSFESEKVHVNIRYLLKISKCESHGGFHQGYRYFSTYI